MPRLAGKVAFITGTAGGQGRAAALLFAAEGARVVGCDVDGRTAETAELVRAAGGEMLSFDPVDLTDLDAARRWIADGVEQTGGIDVLYNNAAAGRYDDLEDTSAEDWSYTMRHGLDLVFYATQAVWPHLIARGGGAIVNTASTSGMRGSPFAGPGLAATKGGVLGLTGHLAAAGALHGIRVNAISPGALVEPSATEEERTAAGTSSGRFPLGRLGHPEDMARGALYLASEEASWVTGVNLPIDGGSTSILR